MVAVIDSKFFEIPPCNGSKCEELLEVLIKFL